MYGLVLMLNMKESRKMNRLHQRVSSWFHGCPEIVEQAFAWLRACELLWMLAVIDLKMHMRSANSVYSARIANNLSCCSRAARDFLGMSCVLERVVPHPEGFVCLSTGNSGDFPHQGSGSQAILVFMIGENFVSKKRKKLTKDLYHKKFLSLSRAI